MDPIEFSSLQDSSTTHKVKNYIPSKFKNNRYLKLGIIMGSVVTIVLIIAVVATVLHLKDKDPDEKYANNTMMDDSTQLVLSGVNGMLYFKIEKKKVIFNDVIAIRKPFIGAFEIYDTNRVFWYSPTESAIYHHLKHERNYTQIFKEERVKVQEIAYDYIGDNLYVIDKSAGILIVISVQTKNYTVLLTDLIRPHCLYLDPQQGLMFILQQSDSILRGNMDGTSMQKIAENNDIVAMTVDVRKQRIYWADQAKGIESSDYEGKNRQMYPMDVMNVVDMAIVNNTLYWLWGEKLSAYTDHRLVSCKIENGTCGHNFVDNLINLGNFASMQAISMHPKWNKKTKLPENSPCSMKNNSCHFCLLSSKGRSKCACKLGWKLDVDMKNCRENKEFFVYTSDNYFIGRTLESTRNLPVSAILPTPYKINANERLSFDYDMTNDNLYFSDEKKISITKLKSNWTGQTVILNGDNATNIKDIAYDWIAGNLYYLQQQAEGARIGFTIRVFNVKSGNESIKTLINSDTTDAESIAIVPKLGYLAYYEFNIDRDAAEGIINLSRTNGSIVQTIIARIAGSRPKSLSIDRIDGRIYWINSLHRRINSVDFNNTDPRSIIIEFPTISKFTSLQMRIANMHSKWIYFSTPHAVYRVDKTRITDGGIVHPIQVAYSYSGVSAVKVFSKTERFVKPKVPERNFYDLFMRRLDCRYDRIYMFSSSYRRCY